MAPSPQEFTLITSGMGKPQLLVDGYRYVVNRYPRGSSGTAYYRCVVKNCYGNAATHGDLHEDTIQFRYHNKPPSTHNHGPDVVGNLVKKHLHDIRHTIFSGNYNANQSQRSLYDRLMEEKLESLHSPQKEEFVQRLPSFRSILMMMYRNKKKHLEGKVSTPRRN